MSYSKEFDATQYNVPDFILSNPDWNDVSWHNDASPRFENPNLGLAVWVETTDREGREYEDWDRFTVVGCAARSDGSTELGDDTLFSTEDEAALLRWLQLHEITTHVEEAIDVVNQLTEPVPDLADLLASAFTELNNLITTIKGDDK